MAKEEKAEPVVSNDDDDNTNNKAGISSSEEILEVLYNDGATPLFLAIEETEWREALDIAEAFPDQVRTWVRSTGTENTTFEWSMWRRLPIHEVSECMFVCVFLGNYRIFN